MYMRCNITFRNLCHNIVECANTIVTIVLVAVSFPSTYFIFRSLFCYRSVTLLNRLDHQLNWWSHAVRDNDFDVYYYYIPFYSHSVIQKYLGKRWRRQTKTFISLLRVNGSYRGILISQFIASLRSVKWETKWQWGARSEDTGCWGDTKTVVN